MTAGDPEHRGDAGIREVDDRPDPGMPGPLDQQDVAVRRERGMRGPDARAEVLDDLAVDERLGEPARDVDRAHLAERLGEVEHAAHEDRVLVGRDAVLDDGPLADRLHEPGARARADRTRRARRG